MFILFVYQPAYLLSFESTGSSKINLDKAVDKFAHLKECRYPLI